jgi:hypothetical protein
MSDMLTFQGGLEEKEIRQLGRFIRVIVTDHEARPSGT